jgi:hypothetical protein
MKNVINNEHDKQISKEKLTISFAALSLLSHCSFEVPSHHQHQPNKKTKWTIARVTGLP